jgi:hypothetical protein
MNSLISALTLLAILAFTEGSLVIDVPGITAPTIHRGLN